MNQINIPKKNFKKMIDNLFNEIETIISHNKTDSTDLQSTVKNKAIQFFNIYESTHNLNNKGNYKLHEVKRLFLKNSSKYINTFKEIKSVEIKENNNFIKKLAKRSSIGAFTLIGIGYTLGDVSFKDIYYSLSNGNLETLIGVGYVGLIGATIGALSLIPSILFSENKSFDPYYKKINKYKHKLIDNYFQNLV